MTEEEAKTKWCPFSNGILIRTFDKHGAFSAGLTGNRGVEHGDIADSSLCIGTNCMAWRDYGCGLAGKS